MKIDDFGFANETNYDNMQDIKMKAIENLIFPLIENLIKSSDKDTIIWPNRKELLEKLLADIKKITRGVEC